MAQVTANGIRIEAERHGNPGAPAIVLIRGLGTQLIQWPRAFVDGLAAHLHVVIFDNRDVGLSQKLPDTRYLLSDMAADTVGVLDAFGIARAHVFGMSLGGMIAQEVAAGFPDRTRSLISMMSSSGDPDLPPPTPAAMRALLEPAERPDDRDCAIRHDLAARRVLGSPGFLDPDEVILDEFGRTFDRCRCPEGIARQMAAIGASGSRVDLLKRIAAPTLVIHGADDPLVRLEAGRDTAKHVPGAALEVIDGMGHDLPLGLVPRLVELIVRHAEKSSSLDRAPSSA